MITNELDWSTPDGRTLVDLHERGTMTWDDTEYAPGVSALKFTLLMTQARFDGRIARNLHQNSIKEAR